MATSPHASDLFVVPITSQLANAGLTLQDWRVAGLNVRCGIRSQIATIEDRLILKSLGTLSPRDQAALESALRTWLRL